MNPLALLGFWREGIIGVLVLVCLFFRWEWKSTEGEFSEFKQDVAVAGAVAKERKKRVEAQHQQTIKEVSNAWNNQLPAIRAGAVAAYKARFGPSVCPPAIGLPRPADPGGVPGDAASTQVPDGAGEEPMACTAEFIQNCAEDALHLDKWNQWAIGNELKVR